MSDDACVNGLRELNVTVTTVKEYKMGVMSKQRAEKKALARLIPANTWVLAADGHYYHKSDKTEWTDTDGLVCKAPAGLCKVAAAPGLPAYKADKKLCHLFGQPEIKGMVNKLKLTLANGDGVTLNHFQVVVPCTE